MLDYYQATSSEALNELKSNRQGLSSKEVALRQEQYGANVLMEQKQDGIGKVFLSQFKDLLVIILILAAIISMLSGEVSSTIVILFVITMNAVLGTVQSIKAQKSLDSLKQLSSPRVRVIRDDEVQEITAPELTIGDILLLEAGDVVGADGRIIESFSLQVNESALTGEVESVQKQEEVISEKQGIADQKNMVFSSGLVTYGRARAVVTAIGMDTQIGRIATLMNDTKERKTPLQRTLDDFSKKLSILILLICGLVFGLRVYQGTEILDALMFAVALAVAAIPEALASIVTIVLAMGTQKMAKENAIIKNINSVESLGCVNVICSDKTGTLTQNKMTAQQAYLDNALIDATAIDKSTVLGSHFLLACGLCADAQTTASQRIGDPTELALVDLLETYEMDEQELRTYYQRIDENPFDSERKLMSTLHDIDGKITVFTKGACDELLKVSSYLLTNEGIQPMQTEDKERILEKNMEFANQGLRVLGFAYKETNQHTIQIEDEQDYVFMGLLSLMDPPREESKQAVQDCRIAGIKPIMITGDHKVTARSIASAIGIYEENDICLEGAQLIDMSEQELDAILPSVSVYARVAPEHKIRIVDAWQRRGNIVAMTGDGVNDAPALKQADIGIAMGITGTEVSKDAASMILMDDNFATIVKAVATGRNIYANIRNAIKYLLSGNLSGILCVLCASLFALPVPFMPVHLLFINLISDSLPAIAIGMEKSTKNILQEKPRDAKTGILDKSIMIEMCIEGILIATVTMLAYFIGWKQTHAYAMTLAFSTLCLARLFHGFNCRSDRSLFQLGFLSNHYSILAFLAGNILLLLILIVPSLQSIFSVTVVSFSQIGMIYGLAILPFIIIQILKYFRTR